MTGYRSPVRVEVSSVGTVTLTWDTGTAYSQPIMLAATNAAIQFTNTPITASTATVIQQAVTLSTWQTWTTAGANSIHWDRWVDCQQETEAQRMARVQIELKAAEERKRFEARRAQAKLRARKLLVDHLSPEQRASYVEKGFFYLYTQSGKCYRIDQGTHGNVKLIDVAGLKVIGSYCSQPSGVPDEDAMLAQKLTLEMDEDEFVRRANFRRWAA